MQWSDLDARARGLATRLLGRAHEALLEALAVDGGAALRPLGWPSRELKVEVRPAQVWGLAVTDLVERPAVRRTLAARGTAPALTGPAAEETASRFETLIDLLLQAAPHELLMRRLGEALSQTSRQVSSLECRVTPRLEHQIATTRRTLDEREREEHLRKRRKA